MGSRWFGLLGHTSPIRRPTLRTVRGPAVTLGYRCQAHPASGYEMLGKPIEQQVACGLGSTCYVRRRSSRGANFKHAGAHGQPSRPVRSFERLEQRVPGEPGVEGAKL